MSKALYRKYRSRSFDELVGQPHVVTALKNAINSGKISHAYLLTGPKGVGKTSVARIIAHEINQLAYDEDSYHLDIIEIDAASNRKIDEIRDLREKVNIAPTSAKYKVYIIDEVHMLTREAFNALLKTLEEPPEHCVFILATTELNKVPPTIISRSQRFHFRPISLDDTVKHLEYIAKNEKINIDKPALEVIAKQSGGSFRDAIAILDQLSANKNIKEEDVNDLLGIPGSTEVNKIIDALNTHQLEVIGQSLASLRFGGFTAAAVAKNLSEHLRISLIEGKGSASLVSLLKELIEVQYSASPYEYLEIVLVGYATQHDTLTDQSSQSSPPNHKQDIYEPNAVLKKPDNYKSTRPELNPKPENSETQPIEVESKNNIPPGKIILDQAKWQEFVVSVKKSAPSLYTALRLAAIDVEGDKLTLSFEFPLHHKKVAEPKNSILLVDLLRKQGFLVEKIETKVDKSLTKPKVTSEELTSPIDSFEPQATNYNLDETSDTPASVNLGSINNIFGNTELIEE